MQILTVLLISIGLAMDALAVSLGIGTAGQIPSTRGKVRLAAHFGIFQSGMTALGWAMGETVVAYTDGFDHWLAFALLSYVGFNLMRAGLDESRRAFQQDPSTGKTMVMLSFATSIDAFAVGLSIALLQVPVWFAICSIGFIAFLLSALGLFAGTRLGESFGRKMEIFGGLLLIGIGVRMLTVHL